MSVGERIIELRKAQNLSQVQLAQALQVSRQAVSKWENDQTLPDSSKMILLADILDTDIEYLTSGRRNLARRPPVVLKSVETVEKIIEKPVIQIKEKIVEVEKPVIHYVEKPVIKKVVRTKYIRNPIEYLFVAGIFFVLGLLFGAFIL